MTRRCYKTVIHGTENLRTGILLTIKPQTVKDKTSNPESDKTWNRENTNPTFPEVIKDKTNRTWNWERQNRQGSEEGKDQTVKEKTNNPEYDKTWNREDTNPTFPEVIKD